ncbi:MAG: putative quinol monooxygenase [Halopseudomonas sp.]|uniref:putative quinol monooxygenase n=1 Tax=Halopseudomonas sp. TaxID=2901191 RepID=UPI00300168E5
MTDTITVVAVLRAIDGSAAQVAEVLQAAVAPSRAEPGCRGYQLHRDRSDEHRFVFVEQWADMQAIEAHRQAPHYKAMGQALAGLIAEREVMLLDAQP